MPRDLAWRTIPHFFARGVAPQRKSIRLPIGCPAKTLRHGGICGVAFLVRTQYQAASFVVLTDSWLRPNNSLAKPSLPTKWPTAYTLEKPFRQCLLARRTQVNQSWRPYQLPTLPQRLIAQLTDPYGLDSVRSGTKQLFLLRGAENSELARHCSQQDRAVGVETWHREYMDLPASRGRGTRLGDNQPK